MKSEEWAKIGISQNIKSATMAFFVYLLIFVITGAAIVIIIEYATLDVYSLEEAAFRLWQSVVGATILWSIIFIPAMALQRVVVNGDEIEFTSFFLTKKIHRSSIAEITKFSRFLFSGVEIKEANGKIITVLFYDSRTI